MSQVKGQVIMQRQDGKCPWAAILITEISVADNRLGISSQWFDQRSIKKVESYLPACNVFGGIWRSFSGAAYWMVCNSCLRVASPLAKPASTQSQ